MKLAARLAAPVAALALAGLTACAPQTSDNSSPGEDEKTGTLRVWLFQEVSNEPKRKVVDKVVAAFEQAHDGAKVKVEYIPVETRAQRVKAAFNDPKSAPDVMEYGNTDTAGYVKDGGLADVTAEFNDWSEAKDSDPTPRTSVTVDGKIYGAHRVPAGAAGHGRLRGGLCGVHARRRVRARRAADTGTGRAASGADAGGARCVGDPRGHRLHGVAAVVRPGFRPGQPDPRAR